MAGQIKAAAIILDQNFQLASGDCHLQQYLGWPAVANRIV